MNLFANSLLSSIINNKIVVLCVFITSAWLIADDYKKFSLPSNEMANNQKQILINELTLPQPNEMLSAEFQKSYLKYQPVSKPKPAKRKKSKQRTAAEIARLNLQREANQKGLLTSVFSGDNLLQLKAVIANKGNKEKPLSILVLVTNRKTKVSTVKSFSINDDVFGFSIQKIQNSSVLLERLFNNKPQKITLAMYKTS